MTTRRDIIKSVLAGAASMAMPSAGAIANFAPPLEATTPKLVGWSVGSEGSMNWYPIFAETEEAAIAEWVDIAGVCSDCPRSTPGSTDVCECYPDITADRSRAFDEYATTCEPVPDVAKHRAGWCNIDCSRCGHTSDETVSYDVAEDVDGQVVCHDCMTIADWRIVDPSHADELLSEELDREYGPEIAP